MSSHPLAIHAENVTKIYRRFAHKRQFATLKSAILSGSLVRDLKPDETFRALDGVTFDVEAGRTYGIIGRNGSGKSTMLKCVAGIAKPTTGKITVNGRISALIELGAGFHPESPGVRTSSSTASCSACRRPRLSGGSTRLSSLPSSRRSSTRR